MAHPPPIAAMQHAPFLQLAQGLAPLTFHPTPQTCFSCGHAGQAPISHKRTLLQLHSKQGSKPTRDVEGLAGTRPATHCTAPGTEPAMHYVTR